MYVPNESEGPRRVVADPDGPVLIEGPVEVVGEDGTIVSSTRFVVALCTCRRSRAYPWCDTSHRSHKKHPAARRPADHTEHSGRDTAHDGDRS